MTFYTKKQWKHHFFRHKLVAPWEGFCSENLICDFPLVTWSFLDLPQVCPSYNWMNSKKTRSYDYVSKLGLNKFKNPKFPPFLVCYFPWYCSTNVRENLSSPSPLHLCPGAHVGNAQLLEISTPRSWGPNWRQEWILLPWKTMFFFLRNWTSIPLILTMFSCVSWKVLPEKILTKQWILLKNGRDNSFRVYFQCWRWRNVIIIQPMATEWSWAFGIPFSLTQPFSWSQRCI